jgi:hypothetical protein
MPERFLGDWPKDAFIPFSQGIRAHRNTVIITHEHSAGARACLGRRCELLRCVAESGVLTCFSQVLRNGGHSHHDYARIKIQN